MTANEILAVFRLKGVTQMSIARKFDVSHVMIHQVIHGRSKSRRIQEEIARILGKDIDEIWSSYVA
ncbi:helix-turn-helix domain-containing protein [Anaerosinus gibii]|uniref:XRE family transcriptional regulator n=1 Tax=Selenobaculum gibii TaxID=3054208 RepID=A0A9Y2ESQ9_9FIRM|nr:XRE family transcriptional regulator [Selenobaculum gbiensis]WIW70636.1 XRE family transcriptional regulator [Selenobaculum gbiensis]